MKKFFSVVVIFVLLIFSAKPVSAFSEEYGDSQAYVLMEASTKTVIEEKNGDKQLNAGYLGKLMTLLLIAEDIETGKFSAASEFTASSNVSGTKGAVVWLEPGDKMTVDELLRSVIVGNANDAVTVLAESSEQSVDKFVMRMNSEAFDLGLRDTAFMSPYGYYDEKEYTTAHDIAVVCAELARFEFLRPYFRTWRDFVRSGQTELVNENTLSRTYDEHIGFKACHSDNSGYCIAEGAENDEGNRYISVVLGCTDGETAEKYAKKLIRSGFSEHKVTATMFPDEMLMPIRVKGGCDSAVEICLRDQSRLVIPKNVSELGTSVVLPEYLNAPVKKGQVIGRAAFYSEKNLVCETEIVTKASVDKLSIGFIIKKSLYDLLK